MKTKLAVLIVLLLAMGGSLRAQVGQSASAAGNPTNVSLSAADSGTCLAGSAAIQQLPLNAGTSTVTLAGTFSATITIRLSANGGVSSVTAGNHTSSAAGRCYIAAVNF